MAFPTQREIEIPLLQALVDAVKAALQARASVDNGFRRNWNTARDWNEASRYDHATSEAKARDMLFAVADPAKWGPVMAENAMVKEQLTDSMIEAGAELTKKLDELGLPVTAAFWLFMPDLNEWRLLFASPEVNSQGPLKVYATIRRAIEQLGALAAQVTMSSVGVIESEAELAQLLKLAVHNSAPGTGQGLSRIRFSRDVVNGHFIDDALIYRAA